jgi:hypothetical protein
MLPPNKEEPETVTLLLTPQEKRHLGVVTRNSENSVTHARFGSFGRFWRFAEGDLLI